MEVKSCTHSSAWGGTLAGSGVKWWKIFFNHETREIHERGGRRDLASCPRNPRNTRKNLAGEGTDKENWNNVTGKTGSP